MLEYAPPLATHAPPPREEYVRALEGERDTLEQRLRRLEREIEALRAGSRPVETQP